MIVNEQTTKSRLKIVIVSGLICIVLAMIVLLIARLCIPHAIFAVILAIPVIDAVWRTPSEFTIQVSSFIVAGFLVTFVMVGLQSGWRLSVPLSSLGAYSALTLTPYVRSQGCSCAARFLTGAGATGFLSMIVLMPFLKPLYAFGIGVVAYVVSLTWRSFETRLRC